MTKIVHAVKSENNSKYGKSGDQTGEEVLIDKYYNSSWNCMLRYPDNRIAKKVVKIAKKLAKSDIVGYDQTIAQNDGRNTLYRELKKNNWNVDKYIKSKVKTECDCSSFLYACWCCMLPKMRSDANAPSTRTMRTFFEKNGFKVFTDEKYLTTDKNLLIGDILVREGHHTVMNTKEAVTYYPKYKGISFSIVAALDSVGEDDTSYDHRCRIAQANKMTDYVGNASQNLALVNLLRKGKLIKVD